jgi:hypothetical protein
MGVVWCGVGGVRNVGTGEVKDSVHLELPYRSRVEVVMIYRTVIYHGHDGNTDIAEYSFSLPFHLTPAGLGFRRRISKANDLGRGDLA